MLVSVLNHSIVDPEYHGAVCHRLNVCNSVCVHVVIWDSNIAPRMHKFLADGGFLSETEMYK